MPFERSLQIESRLDQVLRLIQSGQFSTPQLAEEVGVSVPTISRCVTALRARGYAIRALKGSHGWHYAIDSDNADECPKLQANQRHP